jgi:catechol 2,3-dioxygenase-like lactoylglutathione lyase family enzyme
MLAFFWFPDAPESVPGVTHAANLIGEGSLTSAHASMNHVAFNVPEEKIGDYQQKLEAAGVRVTPVVHHDDSETQASLTPTESTFVRSIYFKDPDGILLEFAGWTRALDERDVNTEPMSTETG